MVDWLKVVSDVSGTIISPFFALGGAINNALGGKTESTSVFDYDRYGPRAYQSEISPYVAVAGFPAYLFPQLPGSPSRTPAPIVPFHEANRRIGEDLGLPDLVGLGGKILLAAGLLGAAFLFKE